MIDELLKQAQAHAKEEVKDDVQWWMENHPRSYKRHIAAYVFKHGSLTTSLSNRLCWEEKEVPLWAVVVCGDPIPYLTKDEAIAGAVALLLEGLASRIVMRKPGGWRG